MFKTLSSKLAAIILLVFVIEFIFFVVSIFSNNGFGAIVNFLRFAPITAILGLIFGLLGTKRETGIGKTISIITLIISIIFAVFFLFFLFGYTFGG
ncbi:hypothetical protein FGG79_19150 [Bacillus sp. BHET2]|uniref:hypothetical protein n=1 Tax=Bacillus sp. BHET2 TaxID=2583818 RepID=UPI00110D6BE3|nr:hypothetical protein [Bacillus sp. BHET2]TMU83549.1 hypothetical protein FGG79_19150 [Bacillus sp. BHET2]